MSIPVTINYSDYSNDGENNDHNLQLLLVPPPAPPFVFPNEWLILAYLVVDNLFQVNCYGYYIERLTIDLSYQCPI